MEGRRKESSNLCPGARWWGLGWGFCLFVALYTLLMGAFQWWVMTGRDDVKFMLWMGEFMGREATDGISNIGLGFSFEGLRAYIQELRMLENGRITSWVAPLFTAYCPEWVRAAIYGLSAGVMMLMAGKLSISYGSGVSEETPEISEERRWIIPACVALGVVTLLPWRDGMAYFAFGLNYVTESVLMLAAIWLICRIKMEAKWWMWPALMILVWLTARIHEGFGLPLLAGMVTALKFKDLRTKPLYWLTLAVLLAANCLTAINPAVSRRLAQVAGEVVFSQTSLIKFAVKGILVEGIVAAWIVMLCSQKWRRKLRRLVDDPVALICAVTMLGSYAISLKMLGGHRSLWCANLMAIILMAKMIDFPIWKRWKVVAGMVYAVLLIFLVSVVCRQRMLWQQDKEIMELHKVSSTGTVYYDIIEFPRLSDWGYTTADRWRKKDCHEGYNCYSSLSAGIFTVVPTALEGFEGSRWEKCRIETSEGEIEAMDVKGVLVAERSELQRFNPEEEKSMINMGSYQAMPFIAGDGQLYYYLVRF